MNEDRHTINVVKQLLDESAQRVSPRVQQRLDDAIAKALQVHQAKHTTVSAAPPRARRNEGLPLSGLVDSVLAWFNKPALSLAVSAVCVLTAVSGVVKFGLDYQTATDTETADLDEGILTSDLPTKAYTDPGFLNYSKSKPKALPEASMPADETIDQWMQSITTDQTSI